MIHAYLPQSFYLIFSKVKVKSLGHVRLFATPWNVTYQVPLSMGFSSVHSRVLEWVAISFSRGSYQPRDRTLVSRITSRGFTIWPTREPGLLKSPHKKWPTYWTQSLNQSLLHVHEISCKYKKGNNKICPKWVSSKNQDLV